MLNRSTLVALCITAGCMRRFACRNFLITDTIDSKLSYTPCYNQYGKLSQMLNRNTEQKLLKMWVEILKLNIYI